MDEDDQQAPRIAMMPLFVVRRAHGFQDEHRVHVKKAALLLDAETHWEKNMTDAIVCSCGPPARIWNQRHSTIFLESYEKTSN
jgi:hypothetical protein